MTTNEGSQLSASPVNIPAKIQTNELSNPPSLASDSLPDLEEQIKEVILGPDPKKKTTGDKKRFGTAWRKDAIRQQQRDLQNLNTNSKSKSKSSKTGQRRNSTKSSSIQESSPRPKLKNKKSNINPHVKIIMSEQDVENDNEEDDDSFIPHVPFMDDIVCPFSCKITEPFTEFVKLNEHLKQEHNITFLHLDHMHSVLQEYLNEWANKIKSEDIEDVTVTESDGSKSYTVNPKTCPEDLKLRKSLQQIKLKEILDIQEKERHHDNLQSRKCLFCQVVCENRSVLFRHMFVDHNFNIGLHDNLVQVSQFLDILDAKLESLQCIYCEKYFTNSTVLRKHMRKKKHFKINARNQLYDKFYIINYLEPGKNWESFENEKYDSDEDKRDDSWAEWDEVESEPTKCLFDDKIFDTPYEALQYMADTYKFDLDEVCQKNELDFYKSIALINYIRLQTSNFKCITCDFTATDSNQLSQHYLDGSCLQTIPPSDHQLWKDPQYLLPVLENDGLLTFLDDYTDDEEEVSQQKMYEAIYNNQSNNSDTPPADLTPSNETA